MAFHRDIYAVRAEAGAVVHTHSPFATALACQEIGIPPFHYMIARFGGHTVRCAAYATFGTQALSDAMLVALQDRRACLMAHPALVADCVKAMRDAVSIPVTVKHRIGIDGRDSYAELCDFVGQVSDAGCRSFTVHARIAILAGLSPKENREVPPLRYEVAAQIKRDFPDLEIILNGGIKSLEACQDHLQTFDGVMLGREAYHNPYLLATVDQQLFGATAPVLSRFEAMQSMRTYIAAHLAEGGSLHHITRHMLGLAQGFNGARRFRQLLSVDIHKSAEPLALFDRAAQLLQGH